MHRTLLRLTVAQYHEMLAQGILAEGEPCELLDGHLVRKDRSRAGEDPMTVGHQHALVVTKLAALGPRLGRLGCHIRTQQPITLAPHSEPEPDAAIVAGTPDDYADRHPRGSDVLCVIEVADSSLELDRTTKLAIYARAGIPVYLIVNLVERTFELHSQPIRRSSRYGDRTVAPVREAIEIPVGDLGSLNLDGRSLVR